MAGQEYGLRRTLSKFQVPPNRPEPRNVLSPTDTWKKTQNIQEAKLSGRRERREGMLKVREDEDPGPNIWDEALMAKGESEFPGWPMVQHKEAQVKRENKEEKPGRGRERHTALMLTCKQS